MERPLKLKLEVLILTMPSRKEFLRQLVRNLADQCIRHKNFGYRIRMCDPSYTLGENRDMLKRSSIGEYIAFIDDDDLVPDHYASEILPLLDRDYVGFQVQSYIDGTPLLNKTYHSLRYESWYEDENGYYRDISHINPMRRELSLLEPMEGGIGEDVRWADRMRGRVKTERFIPKVMYNYFFRTHKNMAAPCPKCESKSTVMVETGSFCNACGWFFNEHRAQKSCLWV